MRLTHAADSAFNKAVPLAVVLVGKRRPPVLPCGALGDQALDLWRRKFFAGKAKETLLIHSPKRTGPKALLLIGLGQPKGVGLDLFREVGAMAVSEAAKLGVAKVVVGVAEKVTFGTEEVQALGEGAVLASYRYSGRPAKTPPPKEVVVIGEFPGAASSLRAARTLGEGANLARMLGDLPGNICTPAYLRDTARRVSRKGGLRFKVYDKAALKKLGYGGILAVNQGSVAPPFLLEMEYKPARFKKTLCVVGKGLTFDSGGISIKPSSKMEEMKFDMCGAAATIGLMQAVAALKPKGVRVIGIVGTTDNLPSGSAYKPGDVITTGSGKTIEVVNTDAEGRVVLSDAIHHATSFDPNAIVDMATLTGSVLVALGSEAAGLFSHDKKLVRHLRESSDRTGEGVWHLPIFKAFEEMIESPWADVRNSAGRYAGSSTAAAFLFAFNGGIPHAHLDIAGTAWDGPKRAYNSSGHATGFGVRLLYDFASRFGAGS